MCPFASGTTEKKKILVTHSWAGSPANFAPGHSPEHLFPGDQFMGRAAFLLATGVLVVDKELTTWGLSHVAIAAGRYKIVFLTGILGTSKASS